MAMASREVAVKWGSTILPDSVFAKTIRAPLAPKTLLLTRPVAALSGAAGGRLV